MDRSGDALYYRGEAIRPGSSLFITGMNRVVWIEDIQDDSVVLEAIDGTHEVDMDHFEEYLEQEKVAIESQPPV